MSHSLNAESIPQGRENTEVFRAHFRLDDVTGAIHLDLVDAHKGSISIKLSPEQVEEGLRLLEEADQRWPSLRMIFDKN